MEPTTFKLRDEDNKLLKQEYGTQVYGLEHTNNNLMLLDQLFYNTKEMPSSLQIDQYNIYKAMKP
ncbi:hypothetical protein [Clostridium sp.]|uniref:hypothetical protein n=1 Tax=Clostridium sp. TaxID=1506 RepID=UPI003217EB6F